MKFIVNSQTFAKQIQALSGVLTTNNNTVPIISCFHFQLKDEALIVKATDLETTLVARIELESARVEGIDQVCVPSKILLDTLKSLDDAPMTLTVDASNYAIEIVSGEGSYSLAGLNADTFPVMPTMEETTSAGIPVETLIEAVATTSFAAGTDNIMHKEMCGIQMKLGEGKITAVATDARKLVRYTNKAEASEEVAVILPSRPLTLVKNILASRKEEGEVKVEFNRTNVCFSCGNFLAMCRLVEGRYPNVEAAIPKENPNQLIVDRQMFLNTLRRVSIFASKATYQVRLSISERQLQVSAEDLEFSNKANDSMPCEYTGDPMEIGFSARFLMEMMSNLTTERVRIEMSHPSRAGVIFPIHDDEEEHPEDILMLLMPMMLAN